MKEIKYCVEIINLFEDRSLSNKEVLEEVKRRNYDRLTQVLDQEKLNGNPNDANERFSGSESFYKRYMEYVSMLEEHKDKFEYSYRYHYSFLDYVHRIQYLFIAYQWNENQMFQVIRTVQSPIAQKHLYITLLKYLQRQEKWDVMDVYIEHMPVYPATSSQKEIPTSIYGYRVKIYQAIQNVDFELFMTMFKKCMPTVDREEMKQIKSDFIAVYSEKEGMEKALKLTGKAPFKNFELTAILPQTKYTSYQNMKTVLETHKTVLQKQKRALKEQLLTQTLHENFKKGYENMYEFQEVFELLSQMDRKERYGDFTLKDSLLFDLGKSTTDKNLIIQCQKAIKHSILKKELKKIEEKI